MYTYNQTKDKYRSGVCCTPTAEAKRSHPFLTALSLRLRGPSWMVRSHTWTLLGNFLQSSRMNLQCIYGIYPLKDAFPHTASELSFIKFAGIPTLIIRFGSRCGKSCFSHCNRVGKQMSKWWDESSSRDGRICLYHRCSWDRYKRNWDQGHDGAVVHIDLVTQNDQLHGDVIEEQPTAEQTIRWHVLPRKFASSFTISATLKILHCIIRVMYLE